MFSANEIQQRVREQPFVPVRITTSAGQTFDVHHPDLVMVGRRSIMVGKASRQNPQQYEAVTRIAIIQVTALEDLPGRTPPGGNGETGS